VNICVVDKDTRSAVIVLVVLLLATRCEIEWGLRQDDRVDPARFRASNQRRSIEMIPPSRSPEDNTIQASVTIRCPIDKVFEFYRDFRNLPTFLGDVMNIETTGPATSRWTIQGPFGIQAHWTIKVTETRTNELIRYETVTSPALRTSWEIYFSPGPEAGQTEVREVMKAPLGRLGRAALALIGKFPALEVSANLHRLKQVMETGRVTDTSYSVPGKFSQQPN
jgi:uncharacterized membrane protein